jgi:triosephosphate isomerase
VKRHYFVAGNWKMHCTKKEATTLVEEIKKGIEEVRESVEVAIFPPFTLLSSVYEMIKSSSIKLGAQNVWYEDEGAYTGEISAKFIEEIGCKYVIIGHSERRKYFKETTELIIKKVKAVVKWNLTPIVCIGETLEEREKGETFDIIEKELKEITFSLGKEVLLNLIFAYEPIWAIGTGKVAKGEEAEEVHSFIRNWIKQQYGEDLVEEMRIIYGGSVKPSNIEELISMRNIDGVLVGGASIDGKAFVEIILKCRE